VKRLFSPADNRRDDSLANRFRRRRFRLFRSLVTRLPAPVRVLDVGGNRDFWRQMGAAGDPGLEVIVLNIDARVASGDGIAAITGDGRDMSGFAADEFDVVFSNSVIEHLRTWTDQARMASEVRRVGVRYFVQTPNRYFPVEPHFLIPGFQFLPVGVRTALVRRFALGYHEALPDPEEARRAVTEIRLLGARELGRLFPDAELYRERVLGLTKSLIAYGGWSR
jgi:hypothetical protein